jgi:hypothetical protein
MREVATFAKGDGFSLVPRDFAGRSIIGQLKPGERVFVEVWKPRNMNQHRAYFAMLNNVVEASGRWPSREALEFDMALALKRGTFIEARDGTRHFRPDSRAVASMKRDDFERLHHDTVALLTQWLGCDPSMLMEQAA